MGSLLTNLNDKQQEAVLTTEGPVLILAGAGSGKTTALTHRIAYLVTEKKVSPQSIMAVTFTNKAADEMRERVEGLVGQSLSPTLGTFHSICAKILRIDGRYLGFEPHFTIYDYADQQSLVKDVMEDLAIDSKQFAPKAVLAHISGAKNELLGPKEYEDRVSDFFQGVVAKIYPKYQEALEKSQAMDFDDLIMRTVQLFREFPEVLKKYQERYQYVMVDEYQDTNLAQYTLMQLLAENHQNICCIGDDWQSIYSWRGADIRNILSFEEDFPKAKVIKLEQNYRSTQSILNAAQAVIEKNTQRTDKVLWTDNEEGEKPRILYVDDERAEGRRIVEQIEDIMISDKAGYKDFAILYRVNAQSRSLEEAFLRYGMPYKIIGGVKFYERKEIKDVIAYLRLIYNPDDSVSLFRIINVPSRKLGAKTCEGLRDISLAMGMSLNGVLGSDEALSSFSDGVRNTLKSFHEKIEKLRGLSREMMVHELIREVLIVTGYKDYLLDGTEEGESRYENVNELFSVAKKYAELDPLSSLPTMLEEVALIADIDKFEERDN